MYRNAAARKPGYFSLLPGPCAFGLVLLAACGGEPAENGQAGAGNAAPPGTSKSDPFAPGAHAANETKRCSADAECDDRDACTVDRCERSAGGGEFQTGWCRSENTCAPPTTPPAPSSPPVQPTPSVNDPASPIDAACSLSAAGGDDESSDDPPDVFLPYVPLSTPALPASCNGGFDWQNCTTTFQQKATSSGGAAPSTLFVDLATYTAADRLRITGVDANGQTYVLLDTCRVRTANYSDPTDGDSRPPDDSIRQFQIHVRAGTRALTFDSSKASTPFYMRVRGLCGFTLVNPNACAYRPV